MQPLPILGVGHVSNVGLSYPSTCAAHRAGISRAAPISGTEVYDPDTLSTSILGAPVPHVTHGFFQSSRWVQLAVAALEDLARGLGLERSADLLEGAHVVWTLPHPDLERFRFSRAEAPDFLTMACSAVLRDLLAAQVADAQLNERIVFTYGSSAAVEALGSATRRTVVLATDSWLDPLSLAGLVHEGRIKCAENPVGFLPGEAGVAVLVDPSGGPAVASLSASACDRGARLTPTDLEAAGGRPEVARARAAPAMGRAIAASVQRAVDAAGLRAPFQADVALDLNGEVWKSMAWGLAQTALYETLGGAPTTLVPAESFGDVGAANGLAALSLATWSLARARPRTSRVVIGVTLDDDGSSCAFVVGPPR